MSEVVAVLFAQVSGSGLVAVVGIGAAVGLVVFLFGMQADGRFLLSSGWRVRPVGQQVSLDTFPMSALVTQNGRFMIVMNARYKPPSLSVSLSPPLLWPSTWQLWQLNHPSLDSRAS